MRYASFFSGIGGLDLGFDKAGMECVVQVENDKKCQEVLQRHWPFVPKLHDIEETEFYDVPKADLYCGGFPCQDISVAGRRAGLNGSRSRLFFEFTALVERNLPRWVVVENVPGLLSSHKGKDMGTVVGTLEELGYGVSWRVLNAQYYGVPQRRRRIFFVACRGSLRSSAEVLFDPASLRRNPPKSRKKKKDVAATNGGGSGSRGWSCDTERMTFLPVIGRTLAYGRTMDHYGPSLQDNLVEMGVPEIFITPRMLRNSHTANEWGVKQTKISDPLLSDGGGGIVVPNITPSLMAKAQRNDPDHEDFVIGKNKRWRVRRLMPIECERLQGFPDGWTDNVADSHRYRTLGNAVCVNISHWLGIRIQAAEHRRQLRVAEKKWQRSI